VRIAIAVFKIDVLVAVPILQPIAESGLAAAIGAVDEELHVGDRQIQPMMLSP
jgi:hypothetical protein